MSSRTGNPYRLPTRISFWRDVLRLEARGQCVTADETEDLVADAHSWVSGRAEQVAAVVWEVLDAREQGEAECLRASSDAAERFLDQLQQMVDMGKMSQASLDAHRAEWRRVEVRP